VLVCSEMSIESSSLIELADDWLFTGEFCPTGVGNGFPLPVMKGHLVFEYLCKFCKEFMKHSSTIMQNFVICHVIMVECENKGLFDWICLGVTRYGQRLLARKILVKWLLRTWFHKLWNAYNYWYASCCLLACSFNKTSEYTKGEKL